MELRIAEERLVEVEPRFSRLIDQYGPCQLVHSGLESTSVYESLMRSILYQQLSGKAASTIQGRLYASFPGHEVPPPSLMGNWTLEQFREVGVSRQKAGYLLDLASKADQLPKTDDLSHLSDEEIIEAFTAIKGVGRWTVEMMLMFTLGRLDVWPVDDMGVQEGAKRLLQLDERPKRKAMLPIGDPWRPYRSVASWYLWRLAEEKPV